MYNNIIRVHWKHVVSIIDRVMHDILTLLGKRSLKHRQSFIQKNHSHHKWSDLPRANICVCCWLNDTIGDTWIPKTKSCKFIASPVPAHRPDYFLQYPSPFQKFFSSWKGEVHCLLHSIYHHHHQSINFNKWYVLLTVTWLALGRHA